MRVIITYLNYTILRCHNNNNNNYDNDNSNNFNKSKATIKKE